jgi:hypothetical protein
MSKCESQEWRVLYRAVLFDSTRSYTVAKRLTDAEEAIVRRTLELSHESGADVEAERDAMDDAMYALRALRVTMEESNRAA